MQTSRFVLLAMGLVLIAVPASALDLSKTDRTIAKEPTYQSKPKYCLVVFGPEAKTRVWVVLDPDAKLLYVDRNGNGDLTEKGKRFEPAERNLDVRNFEVGQIPARDGKVVYQNLKITHWGSEKGAQGFSIPENFVLSVEVKGKALQAKVKAFGDKPGNAPIVHFDGPQTFALFDSDGQVFARGNEASYLTVVIGTQGADRSTFTTIPCEAVPSEIHPVAEIEFPGKGADAKSIKKKFILDHRC